MSFLLTEITDALRAAVNDPILPLPTVLENVQDTLNQLSMLTTDWTQLNTWLNTLNTLPTVADSLLVRALQIRYPRVAEALTILGIIQYQYQNDQLNSFSLDWHGFFSLLTDPASLFSAAQWGKKPSGQKHRLREDGILRKERVLATISRRQFDENSPDVLSRHQALLSS